MEIAEEFWRFWLMSARYLLLSPSKRLSEITGKTVCYFSIRDGAGNDSTPVDLHEKQIAEILYVIGCSRAVVDRYLLHPQIIAQPVSEHLLEEMQERLSA